MSNLSSLITLQRSDLFTINNISKIVTLSKPIEDDELQKSWDTVISMIPLEFYRMIESRSNMVTSEAFNPRYNRNPKLCAYEKYGTTNMAKPLMILNRCPTITHFSFRFIRYYNIEAFTELLSVLIQRNNQ